MAYDYEFTDGFDNLGPVGRAVSPSDLFGAGGWTSTNNGPTFSVAAPLAGTGAALRIISGGSTLARGRLSKTLPANYARNIGGVTVAPNLSNICGVIFSDGGADQLSIVVDASGRVELRRGAQNGVLIASSAEVFADGVASVLEWDVTFHPTEGKAKLWKDGLPTSIDLSGINTCATVNGHHNTLHLLVGGGAVIHAFDHFYSRMFLAAGSQDAPCLDNPVIETQPVVSDISTMFAGAAGILGSVSRVVTTATAPGANRLTLRRYTPDVGCTLNSVSIVPNAASATAKFKAVLYADNAGVPGARLDVGTEVVGCTAGATLTLPIAAPKALTGGAAYWLGYITDASVALQHENAGTQAYGAANTYTSGAPASAPAMTGGLASWLIWGNCTLFAKNHAIVSATPSVGALAYTSGATAGDKDMFAFPPLVSTPQTIHTVAIKARISKSDGGARTVNLKQKSAAVESNGSAPGQSPTASESTLASYSSTDPNTGASWTPAAVNSATGGYEIAS